MVRTLPFSPWPEEHGQETSVDWCDSRASGTYFHKGKLLLTGVVVPSGSLIFFGCSWAILVTEFICRMNQLPRVLEDGKRPCQHCNEEEDRLERLTRPYAKKTFPRHHYSLTFLALLPLSELVFFIWEAASHTRLLTSTDTSLLRCGQNFAN